MKPKYYAGIGSRKTPVDILQLMKNIATKLEQDGYVLRSGGAGGADDAFESGCTRKEIYLPWQGFNGRNMEFKVPRKAFDIAAFAHPNWPALTNGARCLMARNSMQVLGKDLDDPSDFIVCWTKDGCVDSRTRSYRTGGTGQAIAIASDNGIKVFNLSVKDHYDIFVNYINS